MRPSYANTMNLDELEADYMDFPAIASEMGVPYTMVPNWARYHRYFPVEYFFDKPVVARSEFERFKREHPELIQAKREVTP